MSSPGVPIFFNESLLKTAMQNANNFRIKLEEIINRIVTENIPKITIIISNEIIKKSKEGILDFTYRIQVGHKEYSDILFKNLELSIKLLTEKYKEKMTCDNIKIDNKRINRDEHCILVEIQIE